MFWRATAGAGLLVIIGAAPSDAGLDEAKHAVLCGNYQDALAELRPLADSGDPSAQHEIAKIYQSGKYIQDFIAAAEWYQRAAKQGYDEALYALAGLYSLGIGVGRDAGTAAKLYFRAANQDFPAAQRALGVLYEQGEGVAQADDKAAEWYERAAEQNFVWAQSDLARVLSEGKGVARNYVMAYMWYDIAHRNYERESAQADQDAKEADCAQIEGDRAAYAKFTRQQAGQAQRRRDRLVSEMTTEQVAEAQRAAHDWLVAHE